MTQLPSPDTSGDADGAGRAWSAVSDEELAEVISDTITSDLLARIEADLVPGTQPMSDTDRAGRLAADRQVVELLAATGFEGRRFDELFQKLMDRMIKYAFPVITRWMSNGTMFREAHKYRGRIDPPAADAAASWSKRDQEDVVQETLIRATDFFLDYGLRKRKWEFSRGATLATYFVGACVCSFIKVCNDRWKQQAIDEAFVRSAPRIEDDDGDPYPDLIDSLPDLGMDPSEIAVLRDEARRYFGQITDPDLRYVLARRMAGETQQAAADELGLSAKTIERRLHYQRKKLQQSNLPDKAEGEGRN